MAIDVILVYKLLVTRAQVLRMWCVMTDKVTLETCDTTELKRSQSIKTLVASESEALDVLCRLCAVE